MLHPCRSSGIFNRLQGCPLPLLSHLPILKMLLFQSLLFITIASRLSDAQCALAFICQESFVQSTSQILLHTTRIIFHPQQSKVRQEPMNVGPVATKPLNAKTSTSTLCKTFVSGGQCDLHTCAIHLLVEILYSPPDPNSMMGTVEEIVVAYCAVPGRGTRLFPAGTILQAHLLV